MLLFSACSTTSIPLNPKAQGIAISDNIDKTCKLVGNVSGLDKNAGMSAVKSNSELKMNAYNDLRNKSVKFGTDVKLKIKDEKCDVTITGFFTSERKEIDCWQLDSTKVTLVSAYYVFADVYDCE